MNKTATGETIELATDGRALLVAAKAAEPHRCIQHRYYLGEGLCCGEPEDYCESPLTASERRALCSAYNHERWEAYVAGDRP